MTASTKKLTRGFTLIELLTALLILSLLSLMSFRGLGAVLDAREHVQQETEKWQHLAAFFTRFEQDVRMAAPRSVRSVSENKASEKTAAWLGNVETSDSTPLLAFSRFASVEGVDAPRRVGYTLNKQQDIELWLWPGLDVPPDVIPARYPVLHDVAAFELRYLNADLMWINRWPVSTNDNALPRALQLRIVLTSGEEIIRVLAVGT
jgi:general secretion pathway protein J